MAETSFEEVRYAPGAVAVLTLHRPDALNALTPRLVDEARQAVAAAGADAGVRALVLTGAGRGFCAGADLKATPPPSADAPLETFERVYEGYGPLVLGLRRIGKPVIAAVNGAAVGAGMSLALACDLCVAARSARFGQVFTKVGLCPDLGSTYFLPRAVGSARARELMLFGDSFDAEEGLRLGFVNRVFDDADFEARWREYAARLAEGPPAALAAVKRLVERSHHADLESMLHAESLAQGLLRLTADHREGVAAFREKRPPKFEGR